MNLTANEIELFYKYVGNGSIDTSKIIFFGNEFGLAGNKSIDSFLCDFSNRRKFKIGDGFMLEESGGPYKIKSSFVEFTARFILSINSLDTKWLYNLSNNDKKTLYNYISNELHKKDSCIINLRPLPRSSENDWGFDNINNASYKKEFDFVRKNKFNTPFKEKRLKTFKTILDLSKDKLIIGTGDKKNKKYLLEYLDKSINLKLVKLNSIEIFTDVNKKIILSNYFDNRRGIKLSGLRDIYDFININKMI